MDAVGWQIGAVLFGCSALIVGIYVARLLNSATKITEKVYKVVDYNERHIQDTIENVASITESADDILSVAGKVAGIARIFKSVKR